MKNFDFFCSYFILNKTENSGIIRGSEFRRKKIFEQFNIQAVYLNQFFRRRFDLEKYFQINLFPEKKRFCENRRNFLQYFFF